MNSVSQIFKELGHIEYMVKESNSSVNSDLVYDAFWSVVNEGIGDWIKSTVKSAADTVGHAGAKVVNAVTGAIDFVKELGQQAWDKIKALGEKFVNWVKTVKAKATEIINIIKGAPEKIWTSIKNFFTELGNGIVGIIEDIKKGWDMFISIMDKFVFTPVSNAIKELVAKSQKNAAAFKTIAVEDLQKLHDFADRQKNAASEKWKQFMGFLSTQLAKLPTQEQVGDFMISLGEKIGLVVLGLIYLPFWVVFEKLPEFLTKLGEKIVEKAGDFSKFVGQVADVAKDSAKAGYRAEMQKESRKNVMTYENFILKR